MKRDILIMYGLFLGWAEILINQIFAEQSLDIFKFIVVVIPTMFAVIVIVKWQKIQIEKLPILEMTAVCIGLMIIYFFMYNIVPPSIKYFFVVVLLICIGIMTLTMFLSFKYYSVKEITIIDSIKYSAVILFINTMVTLIYKVIAHYNIYLIEGVILLFLIGVYYWYFHNKKERIDLTFSIYTTKVPHKSLIYTGIFLLLLSLGYGPFITNLRKEVINTYEFAFVYIRFIYLIALIMVYKWIDLMKNNLEIVIMFFGANIVIINLTASYIKLPVTGLVYCFMAQFSYAVIHCFLGGLLIMVGYLYSKTCQNMIFILGITVISLSIGMLLPGISIGNTDFNIFCSLITSVIALVLVMLLKREVLDEFDDTLNEIIAKQKEINKVQELDGYNQLTQRENEVLGYLISKLTNKEIADKLLISENTMKKHARNIYNKLGVKNKKELKSLLGKI